MSAPQDTPMSETQIRPVFRRRPWLAPIVLLLAFPLYLVVGTLEGLKWWLEEARCCLQVLRGFR